MLRMVTILTASALLTPLASKAADGDTPKPRSGNSRWNVALIIFDGMELLDFAGPGEVFAAAGPYKVYTVGETEQPIVSQGFVKITPQYSIDNCPPPDLIVIPGGNTSKVQRSEKMMGWIKKESAEARQVMSVCTGALVLAKLGLLDGQEATTHHSAIGTLRRQYPNIKVLDDRRIVDNGKVLTSAGVSAGIDGALYVVAKMRGLKAAQQTARYMEYHWEPDPALKSAADVKAKDEVKK